jgi:superfamily II DNA or RNA helicase
MIEYGMPENIIGNVYAQKKEFDKPITISTWQSLMNNHHELNRYDCVIFDECHSLVAYQLSKIAMKCKRARFRFGFTGTLPTNKLELYQIKSYIGPVLRDYGANELSEKGYLSKCNIKIINVSYNDKLIGDYNEIKNTVFTNENRMKIITDLSKRTNDNVLILVGLVEKEGEILYEYIKNNTENKTVVFLSGKTSVDVREEWRKKLNEEKNIIMIATYGIASTGLNIPSLKHLILASPFKSEIRTLQSIGRALRLHSSKTKGAIIYDIIDNTRYLSRHGKKRLEYYKAEKFNLIESGSFNL